MKNNSANDLIPYNILSTKLHILLVFDVHYYEGKKCERNNWKKAKTRCIIKTNSCTNPIQHCNINWSIQVTHAHQFSSLKATHKDQCTGDVVLPAWNIKLTTLHIMRTTGRVYRLGTYMSITNFTKHYYIYLTSLIDLN